MRLVLAAAALVWGIASFAVLRSAPAAHWCGLALAHTGAHLGHIALFAAPLPLIVVLAARERRAGPTLYK
jgi:hypothetical protein